MRPAFLTGLMSLVVGAVAGLGGGAWFMHAYAPKEARAMGRPDDNSTSTRQSFETLAEVIRANERAVLAGTQHSASETRTEDKPKHTAPSREERIQRWRERYAKRLEGVQTQARDPAWAEKTEALFRKDFQEHAGKFEADVLDVECKTTGCLVQVRWDSYRKGKAKFMDIVHESFSTNCATTMDIGIEPSNPEAPHQAMVIFECEGARLKDTGANL